MKCNKTLSPSLEETDPDVLNTFLQLFPQEVKEAAGRGAAHCVLQRTSSTGLTF